MLYSNATEVVLVLMRSRDGREPLRMMESELGGERLGETRIRRARVIDYRIKFQEAGESVGALQIQWGFVLMDI